MKHAIICLDIGTSGIKIGLVDTQLNILFSASSQTGISESSFCLRNFFLLCTQLLHTVAEKAQKDHIDVCGINLSGQMGGLVGVNKEGEPLTNFDSGIETDSEKYNKKLHQILNTKVYSTTCGSPRNTAKIMKWKEDYPEIYKQIEVFLPLHSYILTKLSGLPPRNIPIDHTMIAFFGNEDAIKLNWSYELTRALHLDVTKFPDICTPTTQIGILSKEIANITGLQSGIPLFAGLGDQPSGLLGAGFTRSTNLFAILGSTSLLFAGSREFIPDPEKRIMYIPTVFGNEFYPFTYINGAGLTIPWFSSLCMGDDNIGALSILTESAKNIPLGAGSLLFLPYMAGKQCPYSPEDTGSWIGLTWKHNKSHMFRSILESIAYSYASDIKHMKKILNVDPNFIYCTGGGSKNSLWNQIIADVTGFPVGVHQSYHSTLKGSAITGLIGLDLLEKTPASPNHSVDSISSPNLINTKKYISYVELFENAPNLAISDLFCRLFEL